MRYRSLCVGRCWSGRVVFIALDLKAQQIFAYSQFGSLINYDILIGDLVDIFP